jgi:hypothetical protein
MERKTVSPHLINVHFIIINHFMFHEKTNFSKLETGSLKEFLSEEGK